MSDSPTSSIRILAGVAIITVVILFSIWFGISRSAFEKIATALAMPCGLIWYLLICGIAVTWNGQHRRTAGLLFGTWLLLTIVGSGLSASLMSKNIEGPYLDIHPLQEEPFDVIVLLGGGAFTGGNGRNQASDRVVLPAQMYHAGLVQQIICTGRAIKELDRQAQDPADVSADILMKLGVPESAISMVGGRTTAEEMVELGQRFGDSKERIGLVTSAWHLRRAMRLAERNGFHPDPLPSHFYAPPHGRRTIGQLILSVIPDGEALFKNQAILKEYLGALVGR